MSHSNIATFETLKAELRPYENTLVLDHFEVVNLIDVEDHPNDDFYWVYFSLYRGKYLSSCVGGWVPLKGHIPDDDYERLKYVWNLNFKRRFGAQ